MKNIILTAFLLCTSIRCMAQESRFRQQETDSLGYITFAKVNTDVYPQPMSQSAELLKSMYSKRSADELKPSETRKEIRDKLGYIHQYYQQYYRNVKVEYGGATVHSDKQGNIETIFGYFKSVGEVDTNPALLEAQSLEYALKHIGAETYKWQIPEEEQWIKEYYNDTYHPAGELVIVKDRLKTDHIYRLAYRFDIYAHKPMSRDYIWVDAITGDILNIESRIHTANTTGTGAYYQISQMNASSSFYRAYPNPVSDELTVTNASLSDAATPANPPYTVYLYSNNGTAVRQLVTQIGEISLNVSKLPDGIYYLTIDVGNGTKLEVHKIIVRH